MTKEALRSILPEGWPRPRGYANGMLGTGSVLFVAGQIGATPDGAIPSDDFVAQFAQALDNVLAVVHAAGGAANNVARMTIYVTRVDDYRTNLKQVGRIWRARFENHYPAMALVAVSALVEPRALVEIEATAVLGSA